LIGKIGRGFARLRESLSRTRTSLGEGIRSVVTGRSSFDEAMWEEIEELLLKSDVGGKTAAEIVEELKRSSARWKRPDSGEIFAALRELLVKRLSSERSSELNFPGTKPAVFLVVGVNGTGKTTTIGKLASLLRSEGKRALLVAGDTYRTAAVEQLSVWADRIGVGIVKGAQGADPGAVTYDGLEAAIARGVDVVIVDTAGRLHTKVNLMEELAKVKRTLAKKLPGAPHEVLLVLDASTGQNALQQARIFGESLGVTGLVLAKLDGTARGGVVLAIRRELGIPIKLVGTGETAEDLDRFDPIAFAEALVPSTDAS
jgi:fused signal recognition particle receptor